MNICLFPTADLCGKAEVIKLAPDSLTSTYVKSRMLKGFASTAAEFMDASRILSPKVNFNCLSQV
jgi:hypothetical protein